MTSTADAVPEEDFDKILKAEHAEFSKDVEIERILKAFKLDAYSVLDILPGCTTKDIRNTFRKKSLLIHPDKTTNEKAPEAFDKLKKAEGELMDEKHRERIDSAIATARRMLINERKWTVDNPELETPEFTEDLRHKTREVLIDDELARRRKRALQMAEEGRNRAEEEAREMEKRRQKMQEKVWETTRDARIGDWRKFTGQSSVTLDVPPPPPSDSQPARKKVKKEKKEKIKLLG